MSEREAVQEVCAKFKEQYFDFRWKTYKDWEVQPEKLYKSMLKAETLDEVDALIGNNTWTRKCRRRIKKERP